MNRAVVAGGLALALALTWGPSLGRAESDPKPPAQPADASTPPASGAGAGSGTTTEVASKPPVYKLPKLGKPRGRIGGGRRGPLDGTASLQALVPDHVGETTAKQPALYWYLGTPVKEGVALELTLIDERSVDPLVDAKLAAPAGPGLQRIALADYGIDLEPGQEYQWSISLVPDPKDRSKDVVTTGWIERVAAPADLAERLAAAGPAGAASIYGEEGLWYDMIDALAAPLPGKSGPDATRELESLFALAGLSQPGAAAPR
jgi:hypothetical protein